MKKLLLTILFCLCAVSAYADEITLNPSADTLMRDGIYATTNYDTTGLGTKDASSDYARSSVMMFDLSSLAGMTISAAVFKVTLNGAEESSATVNIFECLRSWVEAQATWNIYSTGNSWTTGGCRGDGTDMDGTWGNGTSALAYRNLASAADGTQVSFTSNAGLVTYLQANVGGTANFTIQQETGDDANFFFYDSENATEAARPQLVITYTGGASGRMATRILWVR